MKKDLVVFAVSLIISGLSVCFFYNQTLGKGILRDFEEITEAVNNKSAIKIFYPLEHFSAAIPDIDLKNHSALFIQENSTFPKPDLFKQNSTIFIIFPDKYHDFIKKSELYRLPSENITTIKGYTIVEIKK
jgi:hypothetical protein